MAVLFYERFLLMSNPIEVIQPMQAQSELITAIASHIATAFGVNVSPVYQVRALSSYLEDETLIQTIPGQWTQVGSPDEVIDLVEELRSAMYRTGSGTWFSARIAISLEGSVDADFDYDNEPNWDDPVSALWYASDLKKYPRSETGRPQWLQQRLAEAAAVGGQ